MVVAAWKGFRKAREFERGVSMEMESEVLERERERRGWGVWKLPLRGNETTILPLPLTKRSWAAGSPKCVTLSFANNKILFVVCASLLLLLGFLTAYFFYKTTKR